MQLLIKGGLGGAGLALRGLLAQPAPPKPVAVVEIRRTGITSIAARIGSHQGRSRGSRRKRLAQDCANP